MTKLNLLFHLVCVSKIMHFFCFTIDLTIARRPKPDSR